LLAGVFALVGLSVPLIARADAAADLAAIEHGHLPTAVEFLGWGADGTGFARSTVCMHSGATRCVVQFYRLAPGHDPVVTTVLETSALDDCHGHWNHCEGLTPQMRAQFVAADARALAALPPHTTTPAVPTPTAAFGSIASGPIVLRIHSSAHDLEDAPVTLQLVDSHGIAESVATIDRTDFVLHDTIPEVRLSPDGRRAFIVAAYEEHSTEMRESTVVPTVIDVSRARAVLVNTLGFRAYRAADLPGALTLFREATTIDPTFALGWYNRASVEARTGDATSAVASLARVASLDAAQAHHACVDHDFDTVRAHGGFAASASCAGASTVH